MYREDQLNRSRRVIGLTIDRNRSAILATAVEVSGRGDEVRASLAGFVDVPLDAVMRAAIRDAAGSNPGAITVLDAALGLAYADAAVQARAETGWKRKDVDAIGSRGVTVCLQATPIELGGAFVTGVMELGDANGIAEALGAPVVSGFAARDLAAGGRGAPLEALADYLVFHDATLNRVVQRGANPGYGIWLPAGCGPDDVCVVSLESPPSQPDEVVLINEDPATLFKATKWRKTIPVAFGWFDESYGAAVFALLADRTMQGIPGNLPQLTGAGRAVVLGSVTPGR